MQGPLHIRYHGFEPSSVLSSLIEERVDLLERRFDHITDCRVALEQSHHRHRKGNTLKVTIEIRVPGKEIVVSRDRPELPDHDDPYIVLRDAFDAAQRMLEEYVEKMRGEVKIHQNTYKDGKVIKIFPQDGFGFIQASDESEIYFHENAVINNRFGDCHIGTVVKFVEAQGEQGPQASTVFLIKI